jgi:hypothetical protein
LLFEIFIHLKLGKYTITSAPPPSVSPQLGFPSGLAQFREIVSLNHRNMHLNHGGPYCKIVRWRDVTPNHSIKFHTKYVNTCFEQALQKQAKVHS